MPWGLKRYQQARCLHYLTFSCYRRAPLLDTGAKRRVVEVTLERVRRWYGFYVTAYVVMPEHVHLAGQRTGARAVVGGHSDVEASHGA